MKKIKKVMVFMNGFAAVFDEDGSQVPELQGKWEDVEGLVWSHVDPETELVFQDPSMERRRRQAERMAERLSDVGPLAHLLGLPQGHERLPDGLIARPCTCTEFAEQGFLAGHDCPECGGRLGDGSELAIILDPVIPGISPSRRMPPECGSDEISSGSEVVFHLHRRCAEKIADLIRPPSFSITGMKGRMESAIKQVALARGQFEVYHGHEPTHVWLNDKQLEEIIYENCSTISLSEMRERRPLICGLELVESRPISRSEQVYVASKPWMTEGPCFAFDLIGLTSYDQLVGKQWQIDCGCHLTSTRVFIPTDVKVPRGLHFVIDGEGREGRRGKCSEISTQHVPRWITGPRRGQVREIPLPLKYLVDRKATPLFDFRGEAVSKVPVAPPVPEWMKGSFSKPRRVRRFD